MNCQKRCCCNANKYFVNKCNHGTGFRPKCRIFEGKPSVCGQVRCVKKSQLKVALGILVIIIINHILSPSLTVSSFSSNECQRISADQFCAQLLSYYQMRVGQIKRYCLMMGSGIQTNYLLIPNPKLRS